ncbi:hypothetical protein E6P18_05300 [Salmonella enterica]|uniref:hypothetical protein n=1 Tax=Escherichia coli TaxID=562 RepID=UPI0005436A50|nr:hypothetical protein [Escherichia coli]EAM7588285.1 hypothetical protein [Salmonella enterica]EAY9846117.1 hypothetical protein [Salmonella enterica subsp. enterica serovar Johannesburg]ECH7858759.1 hypothetical protein [Salmonella enterica subsp. enterica serovar Brandenburg]EEO0482784.1 hypothetical protein [Salmonella enterica subsp. enterica]EEZ9775829.1 hypothetical protein [Escherichia coli O25]
MSNIDKRDIHNQQLKAFITGFLTDPAHDNQSPRSMTAEVFRIALASLEADPVAWRSLYYENHGLLTDSKNVLASWQKQGWECEPLYTAPPAPISDSLLSDLLTIAKTAANAADECAHAEFGDDSMEHSAAIADWERRAAMLQGADGNSPVIAKAYDIEAFGVFSATEGKNGLLLQIEQFWFGTENCPQIGKENMVPKFALQAIINRLQAHCNSMGEDTLIDIFASSAAPQQEDK